MMIKALIFDCFGVLVIEDFTGKLLEGEAKNADLLDYMRILRKKYKIGMLSNVSRKGLLDRFSEAELTRYFDNVTISGDIGYAKPQVQAYEIAADRLGVRLNEVIFIDDREAYCHAARSVGMKALLYESFDVMKPQLESLLTREL